MQRIGRDWRDDGGSKFFALDWADVISRLATWDALSPDTRARIAHLKSGVALPAHTLGADLALLEHAGILDVMLNRATARLSQAAQPFVRLLRALERHDLFGRHDTDAFLAYLADHLTYDERRSLTGTVPGWGSEWVLARQVTSVTWTRRFIDDPEPASFLPQDSVTAARRLVAWFFQNPRPLPLRELPRHFSALTPAALAAGLRLCFERMLLFPAFLRPERTVIVGLWPTVARRLAQPAPARPIPFEADRSFEGAYLLDDMTALLVAASAEPLRLRKQDGALFERTSATLAAQITPTPEWLRQPIWFAGDARVRRARALLQAMKLLVVTRGALRPGRTAAAWLSLDEKERLRNVFDWLRVGVDDVERSSSAPRPAPGRTEPDDARFARTPAHDLDSLDDTDLDDIDDADFDDLDDNAVEDFHDDDEWIDQDELVVAFDHSLGHGRPILVRRFRIFPSTIARWATPLMQPTLLAAVRTAFGGLPAEGFSPLDAFLTYQSRCMNPLLDADESSQRTVRANTGSAGTDEELEDLWTNVLGEFCYERLLPLGGLAIGAEDGRAGIRLTPAGRYLLGLARDFDYSAVAEAAAGAVIVQPNFEIVFTAPAPRAEATIAPFAERAGNRVGVLFRITRNAVLAAAAAGLTADQAIAALTEVSSRPLPANVTREVTGWFAEVRHIGLAPAFLLRCPDPHTAARVLAAGGKAVRPVSDTVLELTDPKARTRIIKKLRGLGVFVDERGDTSEKPRRKRRRT